MEKNKKMIMVAMVMQFVIAIGIFILICTGLKREPMQVEKGEMANTITMSIWGETYIIDTTLAEYNVECKRLTTEFPIDFNFSAGEEWKLSINGDMVNEGKAQIQVSEIGRATDNIKLELLNEENNRIINVYIRTLPNDYPPIETYSDGAEPGKYYFVAHGYLTKMDEKGNIVFYQKNNLALGQDTDVCDFKQVTLKNGEKRYCYIRRAENTGLSTYQGYEYIVMDEKYNIVNTISYMSESDNVTDKIMHDNHEFILLDDNHYIEVAYVNKRVYNMPSELGIYEYGSNVQAVVIQEIKDSEVIMSWDSSYYPQLYTISIDNLYSDKNVYDNLIDSWSDYAHLNSIDIDPKDGNLVCSFRHFDAVIEINRTSGEIEWILGGKGDEFGLTEEQKFSHQHAAWFTEGGTLILFDNGNNKGYSRAVEVELDEHNKTLLSYNAYIIEKQKSMWMGSAQKLSNTPITILMGWGGRGGDSRNTLIFSEVDVESKKILFEASGNFDNYRVYKFKD